jgi:hypothetical protein
MGSDGTVSFLRWYLRFGSSSGLTHPLPDRKYLHAAQRAGTQGHGLRGSATLPCCSIYASSLIPELQVRTRHGSGHTRRCWWESNLAFQRVRALIAFLLSFHPMLLADVGTRQPGATGKTGGRVLNATAEKNTRTPKKILVQNGRMLCPYCKSYLGRAVYGAKAAGIEIFCKSSRCHRHLRIEL